MPCLAGGGIELWKSAALVEPAANWTYHDTMCNMNSSTITKLDPARGIHGVLTTPSFTGGFRGNPRGGATRLLTQAGQPYWLGMEPDGPGGAFVDRKGTTAFEGAGEMGMLDRGT